MNKWNPHYLMHSGTRGMHWGERNYQNKDGTWTELGKARRRKGGHWTGIGTGNRSYMSRSMFYDDNPDSIYRKWYTDTSSLSLTNTNFARTLSEHSNIPLKQSASTIEEDIQKSNPNRGAGDYTDNNCVGCAIAYVLRRHGLDAQASAMPNGSTGDAIIDWVNWNPENYSINVVMDNYAPDDGAFAIRKEITQNTSGKCGLLRVGFSPNGSAGHMMAWERLSNGNVILLDPQDKTCSPHDWIYNNVKNGRIVSYDWTDGISLNWQALEGATDVNGNKLKSDYGYCVERYRGG